MCDSCVLRHTILGNQQQVTRAFREAEKHLQNTSRKASFVSSGEVQVFFKLPKTESWKLHCAKPACKVDASKCPLRIPQIGDKFLQ